MPSSDNPYAPPQSPAEPVAEDPDRTRALWYWRQAELLLALPGMANYYCLHFVGAPRFRFRVLLPYGELRVLNAAAMALTLLAVWFAGLKALECVSVGLHHAFGGATTKEAWLRTLWQSLRWLPPGAALGAVLWLIWLYLYFFDARYAPLDIDLVIGGAGQVVAACVYGNLFYRWHLLRQAARQGGV